MSKYEEELVSTQHPLVEELEKLKKEFYAATPPLPVKKASSSKIPSSSSSASKQLEGYPLLPSLEKRSLPFSSLDINKAITKRSNDAADEKEPTSARSFRSVQQKPITTTNTTSSFSSSVLPPLNFSPPISPGHGIKLNKKISSSFSSDNLKDLGAKSAQRKESLLSPSVSPTLDNSNRLQLSTATLERSVSMSISLSESNDESISTTSPPQNANQKKDPKRSSAQKRSSFNFASFDSTFSFLLPKKKPHAKSPSNDIPYSSEDEHVEEEEPVSHEEAKLVRNESAFDLVYSIAYSLPHGAFRRNCIEALCFSWLELFSADEMVLALTQALARGEADGMEEELLDLLQAFLGKKHTRACLRLSGSRALVRRLHEAVAHVFLVQEEHVEEADRREEHDEDDAGSVVFRAEALLEFGATWKGEVQARARTLLSHLVDVLREEEAAGAVVRKRRASERAVAVGPTLRRRATIFVPLPAQRRKDSVEDGRRECRRGEQRERRNSSFNDLFAPFGGSLPSPLYSSPLPQIARALRRLSEAYFHLRPEMLRRGKQHAHVQSMIRVFQVVSFWPIWEILKEPRRPFMERVDQLGFFVSLAAQCRDDGNFHLFFALAHAIQSPLIEWVVKMSHRKDRDNFKPLKRLIRSDNNYRIYKAELSKRREGSFIPYLGLLLRSLNNLREPVFIEEFSTTARRVNFNRVLLVWSEVRDFLKGQRGWAAEEEEPVDALVKDSLAATVTDYQTLLGLSNEGRRVFAGRTAEKFTHETRVRLHGVADTFDAKKGE